jgi:mannitol/fructose-specific phosphotransferase system IIA component (Ntr-type)
MGAFGVNVDESCVCLFGAGVLRDQALDRLVDAVATSEAITDKESLRAAVHAREAAMSTGIGGGAAIPHVRTDAVVRAVVGVGISRTGLEFASADKKPVHIVVLFALPADANKLYLGLLAQLMVALKTPNFCDRLVACNSAREVVGVLNESGG